MLQASSIDGTCFLCHNSNVYANQSSGLARWSHDNDDGVWGQDGICLGQYNGNTGRKCLFCSWTGCDSPSNDVCTMTMNADKNVTAVFDSCQYPVKIFGTSEYFSTLQDAYDFSADSDTIQSQDTVLIENVHFDRTITVTVQGGYNCDYSAVTGVTTIETVAPEFNMTMDFGSVSIENIAIQ